MQEEIEQSPRTGPDDPLEAGTGRGRKPGPAWQPPGGGTLDCDFGACTTALEREALVRELRRRETWQALLAESAATLLRAGEAQPFTAALFARIGPALGADVFFNYRMDTAAGALLLDAAGGIDERTRRRCARLALGEALCGHCAQQRAPLHLTEVQRNDDPRASAVRAFGMRAYACHPLLAGDELIGTLSFGSRSKDRFTPDELAFIAALSHHVALASQRLRAERALRDSEERLRATFDNAAVGIAHVSPEGHWLRVNDRLCAILGYPREELLATTFTELTHPDDIEADWAQARRLLAGEIPRYAMEKRYLRRDGSTVPANLTGSLVRHADGTPDYFIAVVEDITDRKRAEAALDRRERELRSLADNSPDILVRFDRGLRHVFANAAIERATGRPRRDFIGRTHRDLGLPPRSCTMWEEAIGRVFDTGEPATLEFTPSAAADGATPRHYSCQLVPERGADGCIEHVLGIAHDITERRRIEHEREQLLAAERAARSEVERAARLKDEFLATLSHELRTPLNAIVGWAHVLQRAAGDNPLLRQGVEVITRNAQAQAQLIADLLDMNRIVAGKLKMEPGPLDLARVAAAAADALLPTAEGKGVRLLLRVDEPLPLLRGDAARLQQVLWNLLSNAIKFTPAGGSVTLSTAAEAQGVRACVEDSGEGIAPDFLPHLFERFTQADGSTARRHGGLGLGLSIARQLVELHGGHISAHSEGRGHGARFEVWLPAAAPAAACGAEALAQAAAAPDPLLAPGGAARTDLSGIRVLLVDDQPDALELGCRLLGEYGARVDAAPSGVAALARLRLERPHVLLSDIGMPELDGYQFIRQVRGTLGLDAQALPAIALTAFSRPEDRAQALAAGFQAHLDKPLQAPLLIGTVLRLARAASEARGPALA